MRLEHMATNYWQAAKSLSDHRRKDVIPLIGQYVALVYLNQVADRCADARMAARARGVLDRQPMENERVSHEMGI